MLDILKRSDIALFEGRDVDLLIESYSNATRTLQILGFTENAQIIASHTTNSDRSLATSTVDITSIPITLTVKCTSTSVKRGACYVKVSLRVEGVIVGLIAAGYVTDTGMPVWPHGKVEGAVEGTGLSRTLLGTDQAAGVEISETVPTGARWILRSLAFTLVCSGDVATREVNIIIDDGTNIFWRWNGNTTQVASTSLSYYLARRMVTSIPEGENIVSWPIPDFVLPAGYRIRTQTLSLQAADNFSAPNLNVEEFIEP